jgi:hypothetical protein
MSQTLLENRKIVCLYKGAPSAATYSDTICCKNAHRVTILMSHYGTNDTDVTAVGLTEATDVASGTAAAVTATFPIWSIHAASYLTADTWTRETDAASYTPIDPALYGQTSLMFEWDPSKHTSGYDCIRVGWAGGHANNFWEVWAIIEDRYPQASPPSAIVD